MYRCLVYVYVQSPTQTVYVVPIDVRRLGPSEVQVKDDRSLILELQI